MRHRRLFCGKFDLFWPSRSLFSNIYIKSEIVGKFHDIVRASAQHPFSGIADHACKACYIYGIFTGRYGFLALKSRQALYSYVLRWNMIPRPSGKFDRF